MRWRPAATVALVAASTSAVACGLTSRGTRDLLAGDDDGGEGVDANAPALPDGAPQGDAGSGGDAGPRCVAEGGVPGMECGGACIDPLTDPTNCGACGSACKPWTACEGTCVDVAANLVGFRHEIPCTNDASPACSNAATPPDEVVALTGTPGRTYTITARFRGVLEQRTYTGEILGNAVGENAAFWTTGGTSSGTDTWNIYDVSVSAPASTFHLNSGASGHTYCDRIDYVASFAAIAGATITIHADSIDLAQARNRSSSGTFILVPDIPPYPAPYFGQFVQVDVVSVRVR